MAYDFYASKPLLASGLKRFLLCLKKEHAAVNGWPSDIANRLGDTLVQGKMIRGLLVLFAYAAAGGKKTANALEAAVAVEVLHAALLIHDDVMDDDRLRRGKPSLFVAYEEALKRRGANPAVGKSLALCVGDALYFQAFSVLAGLSASSLFAASATRLVGEELAKVACAQMEDVYLAADPQARLSEERIISLYRHKTAHYTFSLPLMLGALLAGAPEGLLKHYVKLGEALGIIFQIKDDELGLFGNEAETGKPSGSDIREGKKTLYYFYLYQRASEEDKKMLDEIFGKADVTVEDIERVRTLITTHGIQADIDALAFSYGNIAQKEISSLSIDLNFKSVLLELCRASLKRTT